MLDSTGLAFQIPINCTVKYHQPCLMTLLVLLSVTIINILRIETRSQLSQRVDRSSGKLFRLVRTVNKEKIEMVLMYGEAVSNSVDAQRLHRFSNYDRTCNEMIDHSRVV